MHHPKPILENKMHKLLWDFQVQTDHLILARRPDIVIAKKKKKKKKRKEKKKKRKKKKKKKNRTCWKVDFVVPADHRVKLKESEKRDNYLDLARELKKNQLWNMKVTVIPIVNGALGTVTKGLVKRLVDLEIRGVETTQTTALLRSARILRRVLEIWGDLVSLKLQ